uniref:Integrase, catalytic region, zinc finger, CCHC-type, peptidase aspartic, catalytic n=1 Tax=Tanacetum cinerariifolium TaxID=118510 RepID=A0A6L2LP41_TANCI|nr:integrase, catalytic region, zinc finger, CCHC-type, peptidase aspartic, catalytic [Tanacetum cinerariifolium]
MYLKEKKVDSSKVLDADLVVTESSGTKLEKHDTSSISGNDTHVEDVDIKLVNDKEPRAEKCVFNANHDASITKFLKEIVTRHRSSPNKPSAVHEKAKTPRSCLRWIPTCRIFNIVGLRWVPTRKTFTSSITKVYCEPLNGSNEDITNPYESDQTLNVSAVHEAATPRAKVLADSPVSISISQDAPSTRSSFNVIQIHTPFEHIGRWTKDHPIANMIDDPSRSVFIRKQLETDVMWCYFDAFLSSVEPKTFKQAMTEPSWIDAMQEEIHKFERLEV